MDFNNYINLFYLKIVAMIAAEGDAPKMSIPGLELLTKGKDAGSQVVSNLGLPLDVPLTVASSLTSALGL